VIGYDLLRNRGCGHPSDAKAGNLRAAGTTDVRRPKLAKRQSATANMPLDPLCLIDTPKA
jgi:hypothetical protein